MTPQPIPKPLPDDDEDVHWALSTATALWARGEAQEALKWLRRAAETASDANNDERALTLFKAAADCTALLTARGPGVSPAAASAPAVSSESQRPSQAAVTPRSSVPPPLPPNRRGGDRASIPGPVSAMAPTAAAPPMHPQPPSGRPSAPPSPPARRGSGSDAASLAPVVPSGGKTMVSGSVRGPNVSGAKTLASNAGFEQALARAQAAISMSREARAQETRGQQGAGAQQETRAPKSQRRSTTRNGRRSNPAIDAGPMTANPPTPKMFSEAEAKAAAHAAGASSVASPSEGAVTNRISQTPPVKTKRFEDEITVEHERAPVVVRFDDLDEKTNVLANVPIPEDAPPSSTGRRRRTATDPGATRILSAKERADNVAQAVRQENAERRTTSEPPPSGSRDLSRITSFRVALVADAERGTVEVMPLIPNEPSPAGLVTAILVPIDGTSSSQIAEILGRRKR